LHYNFCSPNNGCHRSSFLFENKLTNQRDEGTQFHESHF